MEALATGVAKRLQTESGREVKKLRSLQSDKALLTSTLKARSFSPQGLKTPFVLALEGFGSL